MDRNGRGRSPRYPRGYGYCYYWEPQTHYPRDLQSSYSRSRGSYNPHYRDRVHYRGFANKNYVQKSRPISPVEGSEEFTNRKIEQTSAIIMRHLLTSEEIVLPKKPPEKNKEADKAGKQDPALNSSILKKTKVGKKQRKNFKRSYEGDQKSLITEHEIRELHHKILSHITNMNVARKKNLINAEDSGLDEAIRQIQQQKRLEISGALRNMCMSKDADIAIESSNLINSIIPDVGIKIEDLPMDVIRTLRETLGLDDEDDSSFQGQFSFENDDLAEFSNLPSFKEPQFIEDHSSSQEHSSLEGHGKIKEETEDGDFSELETHSVESQSEKDDASSQEPLKIKEETEDEDFSKLETHLQESNSKKDNCEQNSNVEDSSLNQTSLTDTLSTISSEVDNTLVSIKIENTDLEHEDVADTRIKDKPVNETDESYSIELLSTNSTNDEASLEKLNFAQISDNNNPQNKDKTVNGTSDEPCSIELISTNSTNNEASLEKLNSSQISDNNDPQNIGKIDVNISNIRNSLNTKNILQSTANDEEHHQSCDVVDNKEVEEFFDYFETKYGKCDIIDLPNVVSKMHFVDKCVEKLTAFRQSLLNELVRKDANKRQAITDTSQGGATQSKKRKIDQSSADFENETILAASPNEESMKIRSEALVEDDCSATFETAAQIALDYSQSALERKAQTSMVTRKKSVLPKKLVLPRKPVLPKRPIKNKKVLVEPLANVSTPKKKVNIQDKNVEKIAILKNTMYNIVFPSINEKVTQIRVYKEALYLATEHGLIYVGSLKSGSFTKILQNDGRVVTCLDFYKNSKLYVGTDSCLRIFNLNTLDLRKSININGRIQCMDVQPDWNCLFLGCQDGSIVRISAEPGKVEKVVYTTREIRTLVSTKEGPRKVLIAGNKDDTICVRDAMSGLILRQLSTRAVTTNSIVLNSNTVFCGTTTQSILAYSYQEGTLFKHLKVKSKGVNCLERFKECLFAGCTDGSLYVYKLDLNCLECIYQTKLEGGSILCMAFLPKQIIIKTMRKQIILMPLPEEVIRNLTG